MNSFEVSLGMKALIELHFQHEALPSFIENVLRSTLSYPNETSKECIQFLIKTSIKNTSLHNFISIGLVISIDYRYMSYTYFINTDLICIILKY